MNYDYDERMYKKLLAHSTCTVERGYFDNRNILRITADSAIEIANYGHGDNLAIECINCNEVIMDFDRPIHGGE